MSRMHFRLVDDDWPNKRVFASRRVEVDEIAKRGGVISRFFIVIEKLDRGPDERPEYGVDIVEVYHSPQKDEQSEWYKRAIIAYGLESGIKPLDIDMALFSYGLGLTRESVVGGSYRGMLTVAKYRVSRILDNHRGKEAE